MDRKLFKSNTDKMICGVCGGVAEYFGIDVTIVRLIWAVLSFTGGVGVPAYLVAAIIIPNKQY